MKKMLFATLMSLSICSLSAYLPCSNAQANADFYNVDCYEPCDSVGMIGCDNSSKGLSLDVDFLWWDARAENLRSEVSLTDTGTDLTIIKGYSFDYKWKPGYRIELGYVACLGGYQVDLFAKWTWFRTSCSRNLEVTTGVDQTSVVGDNIIAVQSNTPSESFYHATSSFLHERLDVGLMSDVCQIGHFTFKPSVAATFVYIQDSYRGLATETATELETTGLTNGKFSGGGITVGAHVIYPILCNTYLYSNTEFSGLWGHVKMRYRETERDPFFPEAVLINNKDFWAGRFIVTQELGAGYSACVWSLPVSIHAGWQFLYLPSFNMITQSSSQFDRIANGLVIGATVGF